MSDSASKKDVEDVLTSIRRLVSNDLPRNRRPDLPSGPGALVLTDADRIERPVSKGHAAKSLEDRIAELEAAVSTRADEYEPDGSEDQAQHRPDRIVYTRPPSETEEAAMRGATLRLTQLAVARSEPKRDESEMRQDTDTPTVAFRHAARMRASVIPEVTPDEDEAPMAEDVAQPAPDKAEVHRFHNPDDMLERFEARMNGDVSQPIPGPGHNGFSERLAPYAPEEEAEASDEAGSLASLPAEAAEPVDGLPVEPASGTVAEDAMPEAAEVPFQGLARDVMLDEDNEDEAEGGSEPLDDADFEAALTEAVTTSLVSEPTVAPDAEEQPSADAAEEMPVTAAAPAAAMVSLTASAIDEETLRPIVAKLIREELQGELGERITRNVRKLVRREIMRAVSSREFD